MHWKHILKGYNFAFEAMHMEFLQMNIIVQLKQNWKWHVIEKFLTTMVGKAHNPIKYGFYVIAILAINNPITNWSKTKLSTI